MSKDSKQEENGMEKYAVVRDPKEKEAAEKAKRDIEKAEKPEK